MRTPTESPRATKKTVIRLPSHSPRTKVASKSKALQGNESPQLSGLPKIPKSSVGKANLFRDLASTNHKQLEDRLSHKHLSSSLADIRASVDTKESTPNSQSPKKNNNSPKVNTKSMQEYYAKDQVKSPFEMSPKRSGYEKPRAKNVVGNKARNNRVLASLSETRSLSPVASSTALALRDEVRNDYGASPTLSSSPLKINLKMANTSTYNRDFVPFSLPEKDPVIKNDLYTAQHSGYVVGMDSTMKSEFKPWMAPSYVRHEAPKDTLKPEMNTFFGRTSYNTEYLNFDSHRTMIEKSPRHLTTFADLAFAGKSSYRDTFNSSPEQREFVSRWFNKKDRSPFPGVPVPTQTTYSSTYKPFKVGSGIL